MVQSMTNLDEKILDDFWAMLEKHNPGRNKDDFRVHWREGYAFYYDIIDKTTEKSVMSMHADVVNSETPKDIVFGEIQKATTQINRGDYEVVDDIDE